MARRPRSRSASPRDGGSDPGSGCGGYPNLTRCGRAGTAGRYRNLDAEIGRPSADKTGTTELFVDAWYIGYVPQLATSVWTGYPEERRSMIYVRGFPEINGENFPLDIWSLYMQEATKDLPVQELDIPSQYLKLQVKTDGRSYNGKESARIAQEWADFRKPLPSKEPQKPPINAPPPPIYGPPRNNSPPPYRSTYNQPQQPVSGQPLAAAGPRAQQQALPLSQ
jgi:membrane carboxypeptidase/penicillin-binding protein